MDSPSTPYYINAMRALRKAGENSQFIKVAKTKREIEAKNNNNRAITRVTSLIPYEEGQYEKIFQRPHSIVDSLMKGDSIHE